MNDKPTSGMKRSDVNPKLTDNKAEAQAAKDAAAEASDTGTVSFEKPTWVKNMPDPKNPKARD